MPQLTAAQVPDDEANEAPLVTLIQAATTEARMMLLSGSYDVEATEIARSVDLSGKETLSIWRAKGILRLKGDSLLADLQIHKSDAMPSDEVNLNIEDIKIDDILTNESHVQSIVSKNAAVQVEADVTGAKRWKAKITDRRITGDIYCPDLSLLWFSTHPHHDRPIVERLSVSGSPLPERTVSERDDIVKVAFQYARGGKLELDASIVHGGNVVSTRAFIPSSDKSPQGIVTSNKIWSAPPSLPMYPIRTFWSIKWGDRRPSYEFLLVVTQRRELQPDYQIPSPTLTAFGKLPEGTHVTQELNGKTVTYWIGRNLDAEKDMTLQLRELSKSLQGSDFLMP